MTTLEQITTFHRRDVEDKQPGWSHDVWPMAPGIVAVEPGLHWINTYGQVALGSIRLDDEHGLLISLFYTTGAPLRYWTDTPWLRFHHHAQMLYTTWKPVAVPESGMPKNRTGDES